MSCSSWLDIFRTAAGRKIGPFRASIVPLDDLPPEERWKIPEGDDVPKDSDDEDDVSNNSDEDDDEQEMETEWCFRGENFCVMLFLK